MHQPDYRDCLSGEYVLPWTYLHAIKDYTDMAFHLEANPHAKATFNFVPVLLDQLEDYASQFAEGKIRDPLLALLLVKDDQPLDVKQRLLIIESCFKSNHHKLIAPFPHYLRLFNMYKALDGHGEEALDYLSDQFMLDLLMWYHLAWTGESLRRQHDLILRLMEQGRDYDAADRMALFGLIGDAIRGIIPRYRALAEQGRIEISSTPHFHPILPLLIDFGCARDSMHDVALPENGHYPGGYERAREHVQSALDTHYRRFGHVPQGMWPAEGGVSYPALLMLAEHGVGWAATGEGVLANSLRRVYSHEHLPDRRHYLYKPYRVSDGERSITCFFRDDLLSDKIGFEYSKWHGNDAVSDFIRELESILDRADPNQTPVVSVILDGENAWEYYPYNGYYFLNELYERLSSHPCIQLTTFGEVEKMCAELTQNEELLELESYHGARIALENLPEISSGSWVYGNFSTWIGSPDKNRGWDLLCEAKKSYDAVMAGGSLNEQQRRLATHQLADCEGSDWFWWFGDYNSAMSVASFDHLYRRNLANLYRLLNLPVPPELDHVISIGHGDPDAGGTMRRGSGS
jgi:alpha-amylase/alpha-mannosidase (GH57 family)